MGDIIALPFRLRPSGSVVTVDEAGERGIAQLISSAVLTRLGERPMFPTFGITDPVYSELSVPETAAVLNAYGPRVRIRSISSQFDDLNTQNVKISYSEDELNNG